MVCFSVPSLRGMGVFCRFYDKNTIDHNTAKAFFVMITHPDRTGNTERIGAILLILPGRSDLLFQHVPCF